NAWDSGDDTVEYLTAQRALQRKVYEAGYAGITWPKEYGGQGLSGEYERAFNQEARGYVMPDLGIAGGATLGVCGPTMVAHASPEFLQREVPRMLAGDAIVAQFFSDPAAGSDPAGVRPQAVPGRGRLVPNRTKDLRDSAGHR